MPLPQPQTRNALGSSYPLRFLLPFPPSSVGQDEGGMPTSGLSWAHLKPGHPLPAPYTQHKPRAPPCPRCVHCQCCACPALLPRSGFGGPCLPEGRGLTGRGPIGDPGEGVGGGIKTLSYLMLVPAGEGSQKKRKGCLAGTFLPFISRFFLYLNLQICIIQGQPIKEEYNAGHWESEVCAGEVAVVAFPPARHGHRCL